MIVCKLKIAVGLNDPERVVSKLNKLIRQVKLRIILLSNMGVSLLWDGRCGGGE
jgi:hypothetical protein